MGQCHVMPATRNHKPKDISIPWAYLFAPRHQQPRISENMSNAFYDPYNPFGWPLGPMGGGSGRRPKPPEAAPQDSADLEKPIPTEESEPKDTSVFKKAGWIEAATKFKTEAPVFAEFEIPDGDAKSTVIEFQVLRLQDGKFMPYATFQAKPDATGRAVSKVAIHKDRLETETFRIQARHNGSPWSNGKDTDREVKESVGEKFEHTHVSGLHFAKDSSFIVPAYLKIFRELEKTYSEWKKSYPNAKVVVYGHAERDETDPRALSLRRAQIAFAFLIGDFHIWGRIAKQEGWGTWEQQHMLAALGFFKSTVTGIRGPKTDAAAREFITWLNESECKAFNPMLGLSEEYLQLELYRVYITGKKRAVEFPSERFRTVAGYPNVGCGASNRYKAEAGHHPENRRATFLLISESRIFPATFPCNSSTGPCDNQAAKSGERAVKGFKCGFYDGLMKNEEPDKTETIGTLEKTKKQFDRISFDGFQGRGYVVKDFKKYQGGAIQLRPHVKILSPPTPIPGDFKNECASLVQYFGLPHTTKWQKGPRVSDLEPGSLPEGTIVATLREGKYHSDYSGRSHVGIYLSHDDHPEYLKTKSQIAGVSLFDQYNGNPIQARSYPYYKDADMVKGTAKKPWKDSDGKQHTGRVQWMKDGEEYFALLSLS